MCLFSSLFNKETKPNTEELDEYQKEEIEKGNYEDYNFEEDELEDDDYYFEDENKEE